MAELNTLPRADFIQKAGSIFEHSPWIAEAVADRRPFSDVNALHSAMILAITSAAAAQHLALIRAHPDLAGRLASQKLLTPESSREQAAAGITQGDPASLAQMTALNEAYRSRFGFPFVICARLNNVSTIISAMTLRLTHSSDEEISAALEEIFQIALLRLDDMVTEA